MKQTKIKKQFILTHPIRYVIARARLNRAAWLAPLLVISAGLAIFCYLHFYPMADVGVRSIILHTSLAANSLYGHIIFSIAMVSGMAMYYYIDYQQHYRPLLSEIDTIDYGLLHHARVVVLPRAKYRWKSLLYWVSFGVTSMAMLTLVVALQVTPAYAYAPNEFVGTWDTTKYTRSGVTDKQIKIFTNPSLTYNYDIDWGDGNIDTGLSSDYIHTYASPGEYEIKITGTFPSVYWGDQYYSSKQIMSVEQWGTNQWATMKDAFFDADNLAINAVDAPNLSAVTDMSGIFQYADSMNQSIDHWDVSNVTDMSEAFRDAATYNQPLNSWDVSNVTDMTLMFMGARQFNQPLNSWNTGSVETMYTMFFAASSFNQDISSWNTASVATFGGMFLGAANFNKPLNSWDTRGTTTTSRMFEGATAFNQDINGWDTENLTNTSSMFKGAASFNKNINSWDTSKLITAEKMFEDAIAFNQDLSGLNVGAVTNMSNMFHNANSFNGDISAWNTSGSTNMSYMFYEADSFNGDLSSWDTSSVTDFSGMFLEADSFNHSIDSWDISRATSIYSMFTGTDVFNQPLNSWDTTSLTSMFGVFGGAKAFNQPLDLWDTSNVTSMQSMFVSATAFNQPIESWDVSKVTSMVSMFGNADSFNQSLNNWNTDSLTDTRNMFDGNSAFNEDVSNWNMSNVTTADYMFRNATAFNKTINGWNVGNVTSANNMFEGATAFNQPLGDWDVTGLTMFYSMFKDATSFNQSIDSWDVSGITVIHYMFRGATSFNQPLGSWDTSNLTQIYEMFMNATAFNQPLDSWNVGKLRETGSMFYNATSFNQPLNSWDTKSLEYTTYMFKGATSFNQPLNNWNTSKITNIGEMFRGATSYDQNLTNWDVASMTGATNALQGSHISAYNYDLTLNDWGNQTLKPSVNLGLVPATYCQGASARLNMISNYSWTISDSGFSCPVPIVETGQATQISSTNAELIGTANNGFSYPVTETGFEYGEDINYGQQVAVSSGLGGFSVSQAGLSCGTVYHYRAYAKSLNGTGYGADETFMTNSCPQVYQQTDLSLTITSLQAGKIKAGDSISFKYEVKNNGPNPADLLRGTIYQMTPPEFQLQSISSSVPLLQNGPYLTSDMPGAPPLFIATYGDHYFTMFGPQDQGIDIPTSVGDTFVSYISGVATADFTYDATKFRSVYINADYENDFAVTFQNAISGGSDFFQLPDNNVALYTYSYQESEEPAVPPPTVPPPVTPPPTVPQPDTPPSTVLPSTAPPPTTPIKALSIPRGLKPATKIETEQPPSYQELASPEKLREKLQERFEQETKDEAQPQALAWVAFATKSIRGLPWILLLLIALAYAVQAARLMRQNYLAKKALATVVRTHELLEGFVEIISHYLGTAATIISLSVSLLETKPDDSDPRAIKKLSHESGKLKTGINAIISELQQQVSGLEALTSQTIKPEKKSVTRWVLAPVIAATALLVFTFVGLDRFAVVSVNREIVLFTLSMLVASSLLLALSFYVWRNQLVVAAALANNGFQNQRAIDLRLDFINSHSPAIARFASDIIQPAGNIQDETFHRRFDAGADSLQTTSQAFAKVYELTSVKVAAQAVLDRAAVMTLLAPLETKAVEAGLKFQVDVPESSSFKLLPNELAHIVTSTVENALKFSSAGGTVKVNVVRQGKQSILRVSDSGAGIPEDKQATLMQPFTRATSNTEYNYEGLGLNLYITRLIAEKYGGRVEIDSGVGQGTTVRVVVDGR